MFRKRPKQRLVLPRARPGKSDNYVAALDEVVHRFGQFVQMVRRRATPQVVNEPRRRQGESDVSIHHLAPDALEPARSEPL